MLPNESVESKLSEYQSMASVETFKKRGTISSERLVKELVRHHDWTDEGARALVALVNDYGAFMLSNALALAIALDKQDGNLRH